MTTTPATARTFRSGQVFTTRIAETVHFYELGHEIQRSDRSDPRPDVWTARWVTVHVPSGERDERPAVVVPARDLASWTELAGRCAGWSGDGCDRCGIPTRDHVEV